MLKFVETRSKLNKIVVLMLMLSQNYMQNLNKILISKFNNH